MVLALAFSVRAHATFPGTNGKIAFTRNRDNIFVINPDGSHLRQLTHAHGTELLGAPSFSADGRRIAFAMGDRSGLANQIFVINADGSHRLQLTHNGGQAPSFSPDGRTIV